MLKRFGIPVLVCLAVLFLLLSSHIAPAANGPYPNLTSLEWNLISQINGTNVYNYDVEIEQITLNHSLSGYSIRSAGSPGGNETTEWIQQNFESLGLETNNESFEFTS